MTRRGWRNTLLLIFAGWTLLVLVVLPLLVRLLDAVHLI